MNNFLNLSMKIVSELCAASYESAQVAQREGVDRIELCSALPLGGVTPSYALIKRVKESLTIPINVLIRPREGDFCYSSEELEVMLEEIRLCGELGVEGVVVGALTERGEIDLQLSKALVDQARAVGLSVTYHRAIDRSKDIFEALETVLSLNVDRVLTSGGAASAFEGRQVLKEMVKRAEGRAIILAGAGVNSDNVTELISSTSVKELHFSATAPSSSREGYRVSCSKEVAKIVQLLR